MINHVKCRRDSHSLNYLSDFHHFQFFQGIRHWLFRSPFPSSNAPTCFYREYCLCYFSYICISDQKRKLKREQACRYASVFSKKSFNALFFLCTKVTWFYNRYQNITKTSINTGQWVAIRFEKWNAFRNRIKNIFSWLYFFP